MILYYTGTGNSAYTAKRIAGAVGVEALDLFERLRDNDTSPLESQKPWVIVTPTYAWRIPRIVRDWLDKTELRGSRDIYFVMTCGSEIGNAGNYIEKWCRDKGYVFKGCAEVVMPENYIVMFKAPSPKEEAEIIVRANGTIDSIAADIKSSKSFAKPPIKLSDRLSSGIVNRAFYPMFVKAKNSVQAAPASAAESAPLCARRRTFTSRAEGPFGATAAPTAWPAYAAARRRRSNTAGTRSACADIILTLRSSPLDESAALS